MAKAQPKGTAAAPQPALGGVRKASRLLECSIAPDKVAALADAQAETHIGIKHRRALLREHNKEQRLLIAEDLGRLDRLAEKVKGAKYMGYVLCYEEPGTDDKGNPVVVVRRADTDDTWEEELPPGAQATLIANPPEAPPKSDSKAKHCTCPKPEHAQARETWDCPAPDHGHMWCAPEGVIEPVPWEDREGQAAGDPVESLGGDVAP